MVDVPKIKIHEISTDPAPTLAGIAVPHTRASKTYKVGGETLAGLVHADLASVDEATVAAPSQYNLIINSGGDFKKSKIVEVNAFDRGVKPGNTRVENSARVQDVIDEVMDATYGGACILPQGKIDLDPASQVQIPKVLGKDVDFRGVGRGTVIDVGSSATDAAFYLGSASSGGSIGLRIRDMMIQGGSTTTGRAFEMEWANGARFENVGFSRMKNAALMTSCYGVTFVGSQFENIGGANIYSTTHCHHLTLDHVAAFNAGDGGTAQFLHIDAGHTDNLVIRDSDFEGCRQIIRADDGLSCPIVEGNYVEYCDVDPFDFGTGAYGMSMSGNWLALGAAFTFHNWIGGEFSRNRLHDQSVAFGSDCTDVHVADNRTTGTATLNTASLMHTIGTFLNSATADATYPPKYSKSDGIVQLHGRVNNVPGGGLPVFALASGYRPLQTGIFVGAGAESVAYRQVIIDAVNGNVVPSGAAGTAVHLDGIMFRVLN